MTVRAIDITAIDADDRLRALDPAWVELLAEEFARDGHKEPIRVVARGERFRLIAGARRIAAALRLGWTEIAAGIEPEEALADAAVLRIAEIKSDILRGELTVLERAIYLAAWREAHESVHAAPKRGRKPKTELSAQCARISGVANDDAEDPFVQSFSDAAQKALGISRRSLYLALKIAGIGRAQAHRLMGHPSADNRGELLLLAEETPVRQAAILDLVLSAEPKAATVLEAIALLAGSDAGPAKLTPPERFHQSFARLRPQDQDAFFDLNAEAIERWSTTRAVKGSKRLRSVA